jgi:hypothetical protein
LFVGEGSERMANLPTDQSIDAYVGCAANCARSFAHFGYSYQIISNAPEAVANRAARMGLASLPLSPMEFSREVPTHLGFASAHRKLEVLARFGTGELGTRPALVDLDTELVRPFPSALLNDGASLHALDLTDVMTAEFGERVDATLASILGRPVNAGRWFGGEFLAGPTNWFAELSSIVDECWDRYLAQARGSIHEGDEALTSAALTVLGQRGHRIVDAGAEGSVARWWSARTKVPMPRFRDIQDAALLHLPADKPFLAKRAKFTPDPARFAQDYRNELRFKLLPRQIGNAILSRSRKQPRLYAPHW